MPPDLILLCHDNLPKFLTSANSVQYVNNDEKALVMTAGVPADLPYTSQKDYRLSQLAHLHSLQNTPSLNLFQLHDR